MSERPHDPELATYLEPGELTPEQEAANREELELDHPSHANQSQGDHLSLVSQPEPEEAPVTEQRMQVGVDQRDRHQITDLLATGLSAEQTAVALVKFSRPEPTSQWSQEEDEPVDPNSREYNDWLAKVQAVLAERDLPQSA